MVVTDKKITVTLEMMRNANMLKFRFLGVPVDPGNPKMGLRWRSILDITDEEFDKIEEYFLNKTNGTQNATRPKIQI
jgi:hypothetical protein